MEILRPTTPTTAAGKKLIRTEFTGVVVSSQVLLSPEDNIQDTINDIKSTGVGGSIVLRNGTYLLDSDIVVPSDVTISGETEGGAIIDFQSQAFQVKSEGADAYTIGSISATNGSATVTGSGTDWDTGMIGQSILVKGIFYVITAVATATSLTIEAPYEEATITGYPYVICTPVTNVLIENLTIQNSTHTEGALLFKYVNISRQRDISIFDSTIGFNYVLCSGCRITGFTAIGNGTGVNVSNAGAWTFNDYFLYFNTGDGFTIDRMTSCSMANSSITSNGGNGGTFTNSSDIDFSAQTIITNTGNGIQISGSQDIELFALTPKFNGGDGIKLLNDANRIGMNLISLISNTGYGANISTSDCDNNTVAACFFSGNGSGTINNNGTGTITANNQT